MRWASARRADLPVLIFGELLDHALLLQLGQDTPVLLFGPVADVERLGLAQLDVSLHKVLDGRAELAQVPLEQPGACPVLGRELRGHGAAGGGWKNEERRVDGLGPGGEERESGGEEG